MRMVIHTPILISALLMFGHQPAYAAALDKSLRNQLEQEASETSLVKGVMVQELTPEPTIVPNKNLDYQKLEDSIASQIKRALDVNTEVKESSADAHNKLEAALENVVASALLKGNKLEDIRSAVAAAMSEIQGSGEVEQVVPVVEQAVASVSTMSAVDTILAAMPPVVKRTQETPIVEVKPAESIKPVKPDPIPKPAIETVTVLKNETLFKIAKRVYGNGKRYLDLYEFNKDTIDNPDLIRIGQVLKVPR